MRPVASLAISGRGLVRSFLLHPRFHILVARHTQIRTLCQKQALQFGLVRVVACRAIRRHNRLVLALRGLGFRLELRVARGTQGSKWGRNHPFDIASM